MPPPKLSKDQILQIKYFAEHPWVTPKALARAYGVTTSAIGAYLRGARRKGTKPLKDLLGKIDTGDIVNLRLYLSGSWYADEIGLEAEFQRRRDQE